MQLPIIRHKFHNCHFQPLSEPIYKLALNLFYINIKTQTLNTKTIQKSDSNIYIKSNILFDGSMFYIVENLKSELFFSPYDMDKLNSDEQIIKRLKEKVEGRCHGEHGYIVTLLTTGKNGYDISVPSVQQNGQRVVVTYSAITFKAQKNDIIDIIVTDVQQQYIQGKIGHAQVMIPQAKIDSLCQYKKNENIYMINDDNMNYRIERGSKVRCKCFNVKIQMNFQMKIMASIDRNLIPYFPC